MAYAIILSSVKIGIWGYNSIEHQTGVNCTVLFFSQLKTTIASAISTYQVAVDARTWTS